MLGLETKPNGTREEGKPFVKVFDSCDAARRTGEPVDYAERVIQEGRERRQKLRSIFTDL